MAAALGLAVGTWQLAEPATCPSRLLNNAKVVDGTPGAEPPLDGENDSCQCAPSAACGDRSTGSPGHVGPRCYQFGRDGTGCPLTRSPTASPLATSPRARTGPQWTACSRATRDVTRRLDDGVLRPGELSGSTASRAGRSRSSRPGWTAWAPRPGRRTAPGSRSPASAVSTGRPRRGATSSWCTRPPTRGTWSPTWPGRRTAHASRSSTPRSSNPGDLRRAIHRDDGRSRRHLTDGPARRGPLLLPRPGAAVPVLEP